MNNFNKLTRKTCRIYFAETYTEKRKQNWRKDVTSLLASMTVNTATSVINLNTNRRKQIAKNEGGIR